MTREEIMERAGRIVIAMDRVYRLGSDYYTEAEMHLTSIVRATLQDAARAGCWYCKNGNGATFETDDATSAGWYHHFDDETPSERCRRGEIHDLIAALEEEGDK